MPIPGTGRKTTTDVESRDQPVDSGNRANKPRKKAIHRTPRDGSNIEEDAVLELLANLPVDDEPLTEDDRRYIREGRSAYRDGNGVSAEDAKHACRNAQGVKNGSKVKQKAPA